HLDRAGVAVADVRRSVRPLAAEHEGKLDLGAHAAPGGEQVGEDVELAARELEGRTVDLDGAHLAVKPQSAVLQPAVSARSCGHADVVTRARPSQHGID